ELLLGWEELQDQGRSITLEDYCREWPELRDELRQRIAELQLVAPPVAEDETARQCREVEAANRSPQGLRDRKGPAAADRKESGREQPTVAGYEIECEGGRGAMGGGYKGRHLSLDRIVALKMMLTGSHAGPRELARLRAEAEIIARLHNPSIVQIYEVGEQDGRPYLALEFMDGGSLAQKLKAGLQSPAEAAALVE